MTYNIIGHKIRKVKGNVYPLTIKEKIGLVYGIGGLLLPIIILMYYVSK